MNIIGNKLMDKEENVLQKIVVEEHQMSVTLGYKESIIISEGVVALKKHST